MDSLVNIYKPAPNFELLDLEGNLHSLDQYRGQIVLMNFWSAECPWVRRADETLQDLQARFADKLVVLPLAANANESQADLKKASQERRLPFVLHDKNQQVARLYGAQTTPHLFIIDERGLLRYQGAFDDVTFRQREPTRHYVEDAITALLENSEPPITQSDPYGCALVWEF